jgi:hypothetical protein
MSLGRYLIGVAALLCVLGSLGVGAAAVRRYLLPDWRGAYARLAEIVTGCALLVGIMEVLGTVPAGARLAVPSVFPRRNRLRRASSFASVGQRG